MKKGNIFISGFDLNTNNRGTQALSYGSLSFLNANENLNNDIEIISPGFYINPFKNWRSRIKRESIDINGIIWTIKTRKYWILDIKITLLIYKIFKVLWSITPFGNAIKQMEYTAAICGGDGFSDIYAKKTMLGHLRWAIIAKGLGKDYLFLPQTLGPFIDENSLKLAMVLLGNAKKVYVRDKIFEEKLKFDKIKFEICEDLSFYMKPKPIDIAIPENAIGINISGLCYYNDFRNLAGSFDNYKQLMIELVKRFQTKSTPVYIIPHSYNYHKPEVKADDLEASIEFYNNLENKNNVFLVNNDLKSPEIKYLISLMSFFIGSRLHSCFAAIFTKTPVFGLAYSEKYEGTFYKYGLNNCFANITNLKFESITKIIDEIDVVYLNYRK